MAIITISRGTFAGGRQLAHALGERIGCPVISREQMFERVTETYGVKAEELTSLLNRAPTAFDAATRRESRRVIAAVQAVLCELIAPHDTIVYHGRVGHLLLADVQHVLRVRLVAPRPMRVRLAMEREKLNEFEANRFIDYVDAERDRWTRFFYGADWTSPLLYDLVINLETTPPPDAVSIVLAAAQLPSRQVTPASRKKLQDLTLAAQARARLLFEPSTASFDVEVEADAGAVKIGGLLPAEDIERVRRLVLMVPGVKDVRTPQAVG